MLEYQLRILKEKEELDLKMKSLEVFMAKGDQEGFPANMEPIDILLLEDQYEYMEEYSKCLARRITRFNK